MLTAQAVKDAIMKWPGLYETEDGLKFKGSPVSEVPTRLREARWRNVSHLDASDFEAMGLEIVRARYIGGAHPKRFCDVVVAASYEEPKDLTGCGPGRCCLIDDDPEFHMQLLAATPIVLD